MIDETQATVETDGNDTAAVLAIATGDKTYLTPADEAPADPPAKETPGKDAPAAAAEDEAGQPKPKKTAQERIDELTRARREDRDFYKEQALRGTAPNDPAVQAQQTPAQDGAKPDPTQYDGGQFDPQFIEDLTDWKTEQAVQRISGQQSAERQQNDAVARFNTQLAEQFPEGPTEGITAFYGQKTLPIGVLEVIAASDIGPKIADHLGDNPAELQRLAGLSPALQARELTRLETSLTAPAAKAPPKTATDAPEPPPRVRGEGGQFKVSADTEDFTAFETQYRTGG
jgi:hypothetical protein